MSNCRIRTNHNWPELMVLCHAVLVAFPCAFTAVSWLSFRWSEAEQQVVPDRCQAWQVTRCTLDRGCTPAQGRHETGGLFLLFSCLSGDISMTNSLQKWSSGLQLRSAFSKNQENGAGKQWSLHRLPLKTEVEIFRGCARPSCPSRVTPLGCNTKNVGRYDHQAVEQPKRTCSFRPVSGLWTEMSLRLAIMISVDFELDVAIFRTQIPVN